MLPGSGPVLVVAPHPDDEVLGVGGTIARLADSGRVVHVAIVTRGDPSMFAEEFIERGRREAREAHELLGVGHTSFLEGFPAAMLDTVPLARLNQELKDLLGRVEPDVMFVPYAHDLHADHRKVAEAAAVAGRPDGARRIVAILAYETLSETNWNTGAAPGFQPNLFVDISDQLERKIRAMERYQSQLKPFPHERSLEAVRALAVARGASVACHAAEAFMLIRGLFPKEDEPAGARGAP